MSIALNAPGRVGVDRPAVATDHRRRDRRHRPSGTVDRRPERDEIKSILLQYKVVFFRDQHLNRQQHEAFAARFGPLYTHPSTQKADDVTPIHRIAAQDQMVYDGWDGYHTDTSWRLDPPGERSSAP